MVYVFHIILNTLQFEIMLKLCEKSTCAGLTKCLFLVYCALCVFFFIILREKTFNNGSFKFLYFI